MNELNRHDRLLKKMLENQEPPYDPASWNQLEQKLDRVYTEEQPAPVAEVDKAVYNTLNRLDPVYTPNHWELLASELRWIARMRRNLFAAKSLEIALILAFIGWADVFMPPFVDPANSIASHIPLEIPSGKAEYLTGDNTHTALPYKADVSNLPVTQTTARSKTGSIYFTAASIPIQQPVFEKIFTPTEIETATEITPLVSQSEKSKPSIQEVTQIPVLQPLPQSKIAFDFHPEGYKPVNPRVLPVKPNRRFFLGAFTGPEILRIQTPLDDIYGKSGYVQYGLGYNAGILAAWRRGRWGVETGLTYISKRYNPKPDVEIFGKDLTKGYLASSLETVDLDVVSIPLRLTGRLGRMGKFSVHGIAGASYHLALQAGFIYSTYRYTQGSPADEGPVNNRPVLPSAPQYRETGSGVLDGGEFRENSQFVLDAGVRLEHTFWPRFAAFLEPTLNYSVSQKGVGPKQDKLSGLSVKIGVLTNL